MHLKPFITSGRAVALALACLIVVVALSSSRLLKAQTDTWKPDYPMILTPDRALALVRAADQKLDYVPGEVLVKFKAGVDTSGQARALRGLRSRPTVGDLEWHHDVARFKDPTEQDATIL